jgi:hypothetical protein
MQTLSTPYFGPRTPNIRDTLHGLICPLRSVVSFFAPWIRTATPTRVNTSTHQAPSKLPAPMRTQCAANASSFKAPALVAASPSLANPVRSLRVIDGSCSTQSAGRMKIVGRFSDVCAELDRMCQHESSH